MSFCHDNLGLWLFHNSCHKPWLRHCDNAGGKDRAWDPQQGGICPWNSLRGAVSVGITLRHGLLHTLPLFFLDTHMCEPWSSDFWFLLCSWLPRLLSLGTSPSLSLELWYPAAITSFPDGDASEGIAILPAAVVTKPLFHCVIELLINYLISCVCTAPFTHSFPPKCFPLRVCSYYFSSTSEASNTAATLLFQGELIKFLCFHVFNSY